MRSIADTHIRFYNVKRLEACPLLKSDLSSLDYVVNRFFMKLFRTNSIDIVKQCQYHFGFRLPSDLWAKRVQNLMRNFVRAVTCCVK